MGPSTVLLEQELDIALEKLSGGNGIRRSSSALDVGDGWCQYLGTVKLRVETRFTGCRFFVEERFVISS